MAKVKADGYSEDMNDYAPQYSDEEIEALMDNRRKIKNPYDTPEYAKGSGNIRTLDDQGRPTMGAIRGVGGDMGEESPPGDELYEKMRAEAKANFDEYDRELGEKVGEKGVETVKVSPSKKTIEKRKVYEKPLSGIPEKVMHPEDAKLKSRYDSTYDDAQIAADEKGIEEETFGGILPKGDHKSVFEAARDILPKIVGYGAMSHGIKSMKVPGGKPPSPKSPESKVLEAEVPLLTEGKNVIDLGAARSKRDTAEMKRDPIKFLEKNLPNMTGKPKALEPGLWDKIGEMSKAAGGKDSLLVKGGEALKSGKGKVQRLFFGEPGEKAGSMLKREGSEALGKSSDFRRELERLNKSITSMDPAKMKRHLLNLGVSEKEAAKILEKWNK